MYRFLATPDGRSRFWALDAPESDGAIRFTFPDGRTLESEVLEAVPNQRFAITYFGGNRVEFRLEPDPRGGTELSLEETGASDDDLVENRCGWVAVLLMLKAAVDFDVDLRNHESSRTWTDGFVDG